jgi:hypothetical protein
MADRERVLSISSIEIRCEPYIRIRGTQEGPEVFEEASERYSLGRGWPALPLERYIVAS